MTNAGLKDDILQYMCLIKIHLEVQYYFSKLLAIKGHKHSWDHLLVEEGPNDDDIASGEHAI